MVVSEVALAWAPEEDGMPTDGFAPEELARLNRELVVYQCALKIVETWLSNLSQSYAVIAGVNPIEYITCRIKSIDSIAGKLRARGLPLTMASVAANLTDIAGARVICRYAKDVEAIVGTITSHHGIEVVAEKDYISHPKPSGYRSYHLVVSIVPGGLFGMRSCPVEIQVRTAAMDFWAGLEHQVHYKYAGDIPDHLVAELRVCADKIHDLDDRMYLIHELVDLINEEPPGCEKLREGGQP